MRIVNTALLLLLLFCCISLQSYCQHGVYDVVYLKNGAQIKGVILEENNANVLIKTLDNKKEIFLKADIDTITTEYNNTKWKSYDSLFNKKHKQYGYVNITDVQFGYGVGNVNWNGIKSNNDDYFVGIRNIHANQFNRRFSLGAGFGYYIYSKVNFVPICIDLRKNIFLENLIITINYNFAYAMGVNVANVYGYTNNFQIGIKNYISRNGSILTNIGYQSYVPIVAYNHSEFVNLLNNRYRFITLSFGFTL